MQATTFPPPYDIAAVTYDERLFTSSSTVGYPDGGSGVRPLEMTSSSLVELFYGLRCGEWPKGTDELVRIDP